MELSHVSSAKYAGMTFKPNQWLVYDQGQGLMLAFVEGMIHGWSVDRSELYLRTFSFSFRHLGVSINGNRFHVSTARFQGLMDLVAPKLDAAPASVAPFIADFAPMPVPAHGKWTWTAMAFADILAAPARTLQHEL